MILPFFSPNASSGGWTQTLEFGIMEQVVYHCATATKKLLHVTNTLAYYDGELRPVVKKFEQTRPGPNAIKLFISINYEF